jgi:hypothetical protein
VLKSFSERQTQQNLESKGKSRKKQRRTNIKTGVKMSMFKKPRKRTVIVVSIIGILGMIPMKLVEKLAKAKMKKAQIVAWNNATPEQRKAYVEQQRMMQQFLQQMAQAQRQGSCNCGCEECDECEDEDYNHMTDPDLN